MEWVRIRAAINDLEPDGVKTSLWDIEGGSWEAMMALVLSLLPNLEELDLESWAPYGDQLPSFWSFLSRAADFQHGVQGSLPSPPSSLVHLDRVNLDFSGDEGGMSIADIEPFMKLKSLRYISAHMVSGGDNFYDESQAWEPEIPKSESENVNLTNITEVSFTNSAVDYREMAAFLGGCPHLEDFKYTHGKQSRSETISHS